MFERTIYGFVKDVIEKNRDREIYIEREYLIVLYGMAKYMEYPAEWELYERGTVNGIPYVEVIENLHLMIRIKHILSLMFCLMVGMELRQYQLRWVISLGMILLQFTPLID